MDQVTQLARTHDLGEAPEIGEVLRVLLDERIGFMRSRIFAELSETVEQGPFPGRELSLLLARLGLNPRPL